MTNKTLNVKATWIIASAVMFSRILGLIREVLFNTIFGTSSMGIFLIAFRAPNLFRDLFAEGALSISFITVFSKKLETENDASAWDLASKMLTLTMVCMSLLCIVGILYTEHLIAILAPGFAAQDVAAVVFLTKLMYPFILLVSLAAIVMGMLNSKNIFGAPALASSFFNIGSIVGGTICGWIIDPQFGKQALTGLAIGTLIGGGMQLIVQLPSLRRVGFRFKLNFNWRDAGIRKILILSVPAIIAASAVQINVLINSSFASFIGTEAVTWLNSAFRLMQFPIGVFGVAVATITLPVLSRIAATKDHAHFGLTLGRAMRLAVFLTLPAAVGLWFFSQPIISLIYEHGKFHTVDSMQTAVALQFYAIGLVAYACIKVLAPGFYAIDKKWIPMWISFFAIGLNLMLNYFLIFKIKMGHSGLALATTVSANINFLLLYLCMNYTHDLQSMRFISNFLRCGIAAIIMGVVCWLINLNYTNLLYHPMLLTRLSAMLGAIVCAGSIYLLICLILRVETMYSIFSIVHKKLQLK